MGMGLIAAAMLVKLTPLNDPAQQRATQRAATEHLPLPGK